MSRSPASGAGNPFYLIGLPIVFGIKLALFPFSLVKRIGRAVLGANPKSGYLVEIRLYGPIKKYTRNITYEIARRFHVRGSTRKRVVPHITIYGPFSTDNTQKLVSVFRDVCEKYAVHGNPNKEFVRFDVARFKEFDGHSGKVICLDIVPSQRLADLAEEMCGKLNSFCTGQLWDSKSEKIFHTTIAFRDVGSKCRAIMDYLDRKPVPRSQFPIIRITLLRPGGKILCEYDLIQNRLLNRNEARSRQVFITTINTLKRMMGRS